MKVAQVHIKDTSLIETEGAQSDVPPFVVLQKPKVSLEIGKDRSKHQDLLLLPNDVSCLEQNRILESRAKLEFSESFQKQNIRIYLLICDRTN